MIPPTSAVSAAGRSCRSQSAFPPPCPRAEAVADWPRYVAATRGLAASSALGPSSTQLARSRGRSRSRRPAAPRARSARPAGSTRRVARSADDDAEDLAHDQRREAERRLVEHQQPRPRHQRAAEREHLALAAGQRARELARAARAGAESARRPRRASHRIAARRRRGVAERAEREVVRDAHRREQLAPLGHEHQAARDALLDRRAARPARPTIADRRRATGSSPMIASSERRLAGAVRTDHRDDAALVDRRATR